MGESLETIFTEIYKRNQANLTGSPSGPGSDLENTLVLQSKLPDLFRKLDVSSLLDIPCGDFNWMRFVDLQGITYIGADIVMDLIIRNQKRYVGQGSSFAHFDLLEDDLPGVDLILCRDCLVHFSFEDGIKALKNIARSGSKYVMLTHFPDREENRDILTGSWRPLNLETSPYDLPEPLEILNEGFAGNDGQFLDKSLAVWTLKTIRECLEI